MPIIILHLLKEVEQAELGVQLSSGKKVGGMLFTDDFVGVSDSGKPAEAYRYCNKWRLRANV